MSKEKTSTSTCLRKRKQCIVHKRNTSHQRAKRKAKNRRHGLRYRNIPNGTFVDGSKREKYVQVLYNSCTKVEKVAETVSPPKKLNLNVICNKKILKLEPFNDWLVLVLLCFIEVWLNLDGERNFYLIHEGKQLDERKSITDYSINDGDYLEVRFKLKGGGPGDSLDVVEKKSTQNSNSNDNCDRRYSNLNLNENYKCSNISSLVQSDSKSKKYDKTFGKQATVRRDHNKVTFKNTENSAFCSKYA
uniref:Ubiquitin-like domain-containing protein n=1 Tax=Panagrolaimus davidi TaxID=227884 RepID=A0A914QX73_9BILA